MTETNEGDRLLGNLIKDKIKIEAIKEFEQTRYFAELKALSDYSLEHPLTDEQFSRMMELKDKLDLILE